MSKMRPSAAALVGQSVSSTARNGGADLTYNQLGNLIYTFVGWNFSYQFNRQNHFREVLAKNAHKRSFHKTV